MTLRRLLADDPKNADAWHGLGLIAQAAGQRHAAIECVQRALASQPDNATFLKELQRLQQIAESWRVASQINEHGIAEAKAGRLPEALTAFQRAIQRCPNHAGAHNNLGNVLKLQGRNEEAIQAITQAIRLDPSSAELHVNLGHLLRQLGRLNEATGCFRIAIQLEPHRLDALKGLASSLFDLGRAAEAIEVFQNILAISPGDAETLNDLGNALRQLERHEEAVPYYRQAIHLNPALASAYANLANLRSEEGRTEEASELYREAHRLRPSPFLRIISQTQLPIIYQSVEQLTDTRSQLEDKLHRLHADGLRLDPTVELMPTHFYLAYQGRNDRDLHAMFARLCDGPRRIQISSVQTRKHDKIRIGFLSKHLRSHTIGQLNHGLIARLSRAEFEVTVLSVGAPDEGLGRRIQQSADRFVIVPSNLGAALHTVAGLGLDILYYPDIGMDAQTLTMAFTRLAPVQCVSWGHPVTTGLPTMDYFLSGMDLEPAGSEDQYTEKLVRFLRLGVFYERPELPGNRKDRASFGLPSDAHLYLCPQTLFKFHPEFDEILGAILRNDGSGVLVLIEGKYPHWTELLRQRFSRTLADVQHRIRFVPHQSRHNFLHLLSVADVMLDPIHFGGGNTSYEAFAMGIPVVTWPSEFLRGRLTYAMYRQMGLLDLVAKDAPSYVELAVWLGKDAVAREVLRTRIVATSGALFDDAGAVRELEEFFRSVVRLP